MTDNYTDHRDEEIAKAVAQLPYFAPSAHFADRVMARVTVPVAGVAPAIIERRLPEPVWDAPIERRTAASVPAEHLRRSIPARVAVAALVASVGMTMTLALLVSFFDVNLFAFVGRIFGQGTMTFLAALVGETSASMTATASGTVTAAGTVAGAAVIASFAVGAVAATSVLRAAANSTRKAA
ncbi:MAG: hypothetical protein ABIS03_07085 [Gemmatimonadaceae bacterium]